MPQVSQHQVALAKKSFGLVSPLYGMGNLSRYKKDFARPVEVAATKYKVYVGSAVVKSTNDLQAARKAERVYRGEIRRF